MGFRPLAGGFLTDKASLKTPETDLSGTRWVRGGHSFYPATFDHPAVHEAVKKFRAVCEENGISSTEASFRWLVHHSALRDEEPRVLWEGAFG
jgi:aflatoxin B1 aldehyde reductase